MSSESRNETDDQAAVFLVFGDDEFEVKSKCSAILTGWQAELPEAERETIDGNAGSVHEVSRAVSALSVGLESLSLFGSGKIVWFRNCNFLGSEGRLAQAKSTGQSVEDLLTTLKRCSWNDTRLLLSASGVDKRKRFYKWFQKEGSIIACESLMAKGEEGYEIAIRLVRSQCSDSNKELRPEVAEQLVRWVGLDRRALVNECEKAILHAGTRDEVCLDDLESTVVKTKQAKAFAFADAVADRKLNQALRRLDEELWEMRSDRQKSEMGLLYGLISKFRNMLMVKDLVLKGRLRVDRNFASFRSQLKSVGSCDFPEDRRFNPLSQNPYVIFRTAAQVGHYSQSELVRALSSLMECNTRLVSVGDDASALLRQCVIDIVLSTKK